MKLYTISKRGFLNIFLSAVFAITTSAFAGETVDVFFAGGQSNATALWAAGIQDTLTDSGEFSNPLVVHASHPGYGMGSWYPYVPGPLYQADFYNASGTGVLEMALQAIVDNGDTYNFRGMFWFQGETDRFPAETPLYQTRFLGMLNELQGDLGLAEPVEYTMAIIDANPDPVYDDQLGAGITRANVEAVRTEQFALGNRANGSYVDTRGYARWDAWHLYEAGQTEVGGLMAEKYIQTFVPEPATMALLAMGAGGLLLKKRRR